jgi:hypothetical protein
VPCALRPVLKVGRGTQKRDEPARRSEEEAGDETLEILPCPMPHAPCPVLCALCPVLCALCSVPFI